MNLSVNFLGDGLFEDIKEENAKLRPSLNYTDCHAQVFGSPDVYPTCSEKTLDINDYIPEQYSKFCAERDISNTVLIQPECYGTDNRCLLSAISILNNDCGEDTKFQAKGIARIKYDLEEKELEELTNAGVIGAKFVMGRGLNGLTWEEADKLAWRINDFGWQVELHMDGCDLHEAEKFLKTWPGRMVLPHLGQFQREITTQQRGFTTLARLIDRDKAWVKISAPYILSRDNDLDAPEVTDIIAALVKWAPERLVWGTNWPHIEKEGDRSIDERLLELMHKWVPNETTRKLIMCDNPTILYGFTND